MQLKQLEKEVKYLSTHVISSSGLIYTPEAAITEAEEQQLTAKILMQMEELERLVGLEVMQGQGSHTDKNSNLLAVLNCLTQQEARLKEVEKILAAEH